MGKIDLSKFKRAQNYWELADWEKLQNYIANPASFYPEKLEINHKHFEDLRRRLFLLKNPSAGRYTVKQKYASWMSIKWANGDASTDLEKQYEDNSGDIVTLGAGEYRYSISGSYNGARPFLWDVTGEITNTTWWFGGEIDCYDGDFTTTPTENPDYDSWDSETQEQYLKDYPVRYIPAIPFTIAYMGTGSTGFTNSMSNNPPINRYTGEYNNTYWQRIPFEGHYYSWSPRIDSKVVKKVKKFEENPPDCGTKTCYYFSDIEAYRYLPKCTDPKEQNDMAFCYENTNYDIDEGKYKFIYGNKVEFNNLHISDVGNQGATGDFSTFCCSGLNSNYRDWYTWPPRNSYGIRQDGNPHPPSEWSDFYGRYITAAGEPYTETKLSDSYQSQVEYEIDTGDYYWEVDDIYIMNWLYYNNRTNPDTGEIPYPDGWTPHKVINQTEFSPVNGNETALYFGCNGSGTELFLKKEGRYNWYLDEVYPPMPKEIKDKKIGDAIVAGDQYDPRWNPMPIAVWRRCWKNGFNIKSNTYYWMDEWGTPPGHIEGDIRMWCSAEAWDYIRLEDRHYYRIVDIDDIKAQCDAEYNKPSESDLTDDEWLDLYDWRPENPSDTFNRNKRDDLVDYYRTITTVYHDKTSGGNEYRLKYGKYYLNANILNDLRNILLYCRYHRLDSDVEPQRRSQSCYHIEWLPFPPLEPDWEDLCWSCVGSLSGWSDWVNPVSPDNGGWFFFGKDVCADWVSWFPDWFNPGYRAYEAEGGRHQAGIKVYAIDKVPVSATIHIQIATYAYPDEICCNMETSLASSISCTSGEANYTMVKVQATDQDQFFAIIDDCPWGMTSETCMHRGQQVRIQQTNQLFWETDWEDVDRTVWQRDTQESTHRLCCECCDESNPSGSDYNSGTDTDPPDSGDDDDKTDRDQPLWHLEPVIEEKDL